MFFFEYKSFESLINELLTIFELFIIYRFIPQDLTWRNARKKLTALKIYSRIHYGPSSSMSKLIISSLWTSIMLSWVFTSAKIQGIFKVLYNLVFSTNLFYNRIRLKFFIDNPPKNIELNRIGLLVMRDNQISDEILVAILWHTIQCNTCLHKKIFRECYAVLWQNLLEAICGTSPLSPFFFRKNTCNLHRN